MLMSCQKKQGNSRTRRKKLLCIATGAMYSVIGLMLAPPQARGANSTQCQALAGGQKHPKWHTLSAQSIEEPVGSVIATTQTSLTINCLTPIPIALVRKGRRDTRYGPNSGMALSNVPGLDFRLRDAITHHIIPLQQSTYSSFKNLSNMQLSYTLELVKTGPLSPPAQLNFTETQYFLDDKQKLISKKGFPFAATTNVAFFFKPTCTLLNQDVQQFDVALPGVSIDNFSGIDSYEGETPFIIELTCAASIKGSITFSGTTGAGLRERGVFLPDSTGKDAAHGFGLQILYRNAILTPDQSVSLETLPPGDSTLNFSARYVQVQKKITPGQFEALVSFEISFN